MTSWHINFFLWNSPIFVIISFSEIFPRSTSSRDNKIRCKDRDTGRSHLREIISNLILRCNSATQFHLYSYSVKTRWRRSIFYRDSNSRDLSAAVRWRGEPSEWKIRLAITTQWSVERKFWWQCEYRGKTRARREGRFNLERTVALAATRHRLHRRLRFYDFYEVAYKVRHTCA